MWSEIIAAVLWVAIGDAYDQHAPLTEVQFTEFEAAQYELAQIWGWP